jgi:hypothetical protein
MEMTLDVQRAGTDREALVKFVRNLEQKNQSLPLKPLASRERAGVGRSSFPPRLER